MSFNKKMFKKTLPVNEQILYIKSAQQGDKKAKEIIVEHNLGLVANVINKYYYSYNEEIKEELFCVGCLGLWKAIQNFDETKGFKFSTYAIPKIYGEIKYFLKYNNFIHAPRKIKDLAIQIKKLQNNYLDLKEHSINELAKILNISNEEIIDAILFNYPINSLDEPQYTNNNSDIFLLKDSIPESNYSIYDIIEHKELNEELINAINELNNKQITIIKLYFGFGCDPKSQKEIGKIIGISQPQVHRILKNSLNRLKFLLTNYEKNNFVKKKKV